MHRVRTSLPFFKENGWEAEVVTVDPAYTDMPVDNLLLETLPVDLKIHKVKAFNKKFTAKMGLGSLALRSLWFYRAYVNKLLATQRFDLIYFSTTQFPVTVLGAYWKRKFGIPYVIDMQDPWHSEYYRDKPKAEQPPKYWFSYRLNKYLEPKAMRHVSGLISVSEDYITDLKNRYPQISNVPASTITFGMFEQDMHIAERHSADFDKLFNAADINIAYIGRGGADMQKAIAPVFAAFSQAQKQSPKKFRRIKFYFIGTSYAPKGMGKPSIAPLAKSYGIADNVIEITDRINYYHTLALLKQADAIFIPGSDDPKYTASKVYPYLLARKPILAIFNKASSAIGILQSFGVKSAFNYEDVSPDDIIAFLEGLMNNTATAAQLPATATKDHSAQTKTKLQCQLLDLAIQYEQH